MEILDNINQLLGDNLKRTVEPGSKLKIAASTFSIYAYEALNQELESIESLEFTLPVAQETIEGKAVFFVDENALAACFDTGQTEEFVKQLAAHKPLRAVFRDSGFGSDDVKIDVEQLFKLLSPSTEVKAI